MSSELIVTLIAAVLGSSVLGAVVTYFLMRRKIAAETNETNEKAASEKVDTTQKTSDFVEKIQNKNIDLYEKNTELEKIKIDQAHVIESLTERLAARDRQLETLNKQVERLSSLAEQAPITETLRSQLETVNNIAAQLQQLLIEKEKTMQELSQTNRDLQMRKPSKT
jgi:Flp pilus assembly protein CpaB